jgi:hypothetical protein
MKQFLREAKIIRLRESSKGVTHPKRATLQGGDLTHDATVQTIDKRYCGLPATTHSTELNVRNYWGYNIASYELAKLLSLSMVPPYVDRRIEANLSIAGLRVGSGGSSSTTLHDSVILQLEQVNPGEI